MRKHQLERDVAGASSDGPRVGDGEQSRQPRAIIARRREGWPGEGFGVSHFQSPQLPGSFNAVLGEGVGGDDQGRFGAFWRCGDADSQANIAA